MHWHSARENAGARAGFMRGRRCMQVGGFVHQPLTLLITRLHAYDLREAGYQQGVHAVGADGAVVKAVLPR